MSNALSYVQEVRMKLREIESLLCKHGFVLLRANKHYVYGRGNKTIVVPRHKEVNLFLAKKIVREIMN